MQTDNQFPSFKTKPHRVPRRLPPSGPTGPPEPPGSRPTGPPGPFTTRIGHPPPNTEHPGPTEFTGPPRPPQGCTCRGPPGFDGAPGPKGEPGNPNALIDALYCI